MSEQSNSVYDRSTAPPEVEPIRARTLILLRWFAIAGQLAAVIVAWQIGIGFPIGAVLVLIGAAAAMNLWQLVRPARRISVHHATRQLMFDLMQLSALTALTGGMSNPFALLVLAPVTIAATSLNNKMTLALGLATMALITISGALAVSLTAPDGSVLKTPPVLALGHWVALMIGVAFFAFYARKVTAELSATSNALFATQMALAREQRLQHLGGVVAAAAHEMGTPLATIKLIAAELAEELDDQPHLREDALALRQSADRCGQILRNMGHAGKEDLLLRSTPLRALLEDAAGPHLDRGPSVEILAEGPDVRRDPAVLHALRNLIQNAVDFAHSRVVIDAVTAADHVTVTIRDDGPGYSPALLARIGDPYLTSRRTGSQRNGYEGMGLGLFIAKTLLERSGATLGFTNGGPGAIVTVRWPLARIAADTRAALGQNPPFAD